MAWQQEDHQFGMQMYFDSLPQGAEGTWAEITKQERDIWVGAAAAERVKREKKKQIEDRARELYDAVAVEQEGGGLTGWPNLEQDVRDLYILSAQNESDAKYSYQLNRSEYGVGVDIVGPKPPSWDSLTEHERFREIQKWIRRPQECEDIQAGPATSHQYHLMPSLTDKQRDELFKLIEQELEGHLTSGRRRNLIELREAFAPRYVSVNRRDLRDLIGLVEVHLHLEKMSIGPSLERLKKAAD